MARPRDNEPGNHPMLPSYAYPGLEINGPHATVTVV